MLNTWDISRVMYYTGHSSLHHWVFPTHTRKGISPRSTINEGIHKWSPLGKHVLATFFSTGTRMDVSRKSTHSLCHCMEKNHQSSKTGAEDYIVLRTEPDCSFYSFMLFSLALSLFNFFIFCYQYHVKWLIILMKFFISDYILWLYKEKQLIIITILLLNILYSVILLFEGKWLSL